MNLLHDPVFTVDTSDGRTSCSLPQIYALLDADAVEGFSRLQAHQKQAWHCFLAQLGAIATEDRGLPDSEDGWREALSALADEAAWNLYTADLQKPAFMQPPVPEDTLEDFAPIHVTEYDVPTLSKNHALKTRRMHDPDDEHWVYMIVNVQTTAHYGGGGKNADHRISRMNGGTASRPFFGLTPIFGLTPSLRWGKWVLHDIDVLRGHVNEIEDRYSFRRNVSPLLWTVPWNGQDSLDLAQLHPLYIDCARRIRNDGGWKKTGTSSERVIGAVEGQTGDPWAPVNTNENKVLNPTPAHFGYRQLSKILFGGGYRRPISFSSATKGYLVCRAIFTDPDKTGGTRDHFRERIIPFSNQRRGWDTIEQEAETRVQKAETAANILSHALYLMLKDDRDDGKQERVPDRLQKGKNRQLSAFHSRVDDCFFRKLFDAPDISDHHRSAFWETILVGVLREQFDDAKQLCPAKDRWHRQARAQSVFDGRIESEFTYAKQFATNHEHTDHEPNGVGQPDGRALADV
jgi:CRISPR system Cascade subunit CasA